MLIFFITALGFRVICRCDKAFQQWLREEKKLLRKQWRGIGVLCCINSILIWFLYAEHLYEKCLYTVLSFAVPFFIIAGCLMLACVMDSMIFQVHNFVWWIAGVAGIAMLIGGRAHDSLLPLLTFCFLQQIFFAKMYGRADCHAFCICAVMECAYGISFEGYLIHMLIAFGFLALVQAIGRNINSSGNLKKPVAFLPYITVSFWFLLFITEAANENLVYLYKCS